MSKRILIAPLDWGLGHATRCIPLIRHIEALGHTAIIAAEGRPMVLLQSEFPGREFVEFIGYQISYPKGGGMAWKMGVAAPRIMKRIAAEHHELNALITKHRIDAVISDNRFGLYTSKVPCVYITHQVMIKAPCFEPLLYQLHMRYMNRYTEVWVPDYETNGLSGDLGHKYPLPRNGKFIGPLSRFLPSKSEITRDILVLISGPEPQRTRFEHVVLEHLEKFEGSAMAVLGTPEIEHEQTDKQGHRLVPHLPTEQMEQAIKESGLIISRSGYSTIMDLSVLGKKAVFVPTPGQTEQEYLGQVFNENRQHLLMLQRDFNLKKAWENSENFSGFPATTSQAYMNHLERFINGLS